MKSINPRLTALEKKTKVAGAVYADKDDDGYFIDGKRFKTEQEVNAAFPFQKIVICKEYIGISLDDL